VTYQGDIYILICYLFFCHLSLIYTAGKIFHFKLKNFQSSITYQKMQTYSSMTQDIAIEQQFDPIMYEEFKVDENAHPRAVMTLRRNNNVPYPYMIGTVISLIDSGNRDPFTRRPFSALAKRRARLYARCMDVFPDYKMKDLDSADLFRRWQELNQNPQGSQEEQDKLRLEAQCFLQPEDLLSIFKAYNGKGSTENRRLSLVDINQEHPWLLRNSSVVDTEYDKAYVLSWKKETDIYHRLIIHRIGEGFYYAVNGIPQGGYGGEYPTIIHLLEEVNARHVTIGRNETLRSFN
jgi:hypothetical protein